MELVRGVWFLTGQRQDRFVDPATGMTLLSEWFDSQNDLDPIQQTPKQPESSTVARRFRGGTAHRALSTSWRTSRLR